MKYEIPLTELVAHVPPTNEMMLGDTPIDGLALSFDALTPELADHFKSLGWHYEDVDGVPSFSWDEDTRQQVKDIVAAVFDEYEGYDDRISWDRFGLSGDDDVDYNSSYPEYLLAATQNYVAAQG